MEKAVRRKFTDEFKEGAVKLVTDQGCKITEAARNLVHPANAYLGLEVVVEK